MKKTEMKKSDALATLARSAEKHQGGKAGPSGSPTCVRLPEGVSWWKPQEGINRVDVIPFVAGKGNPNAAPGVVHFEREFLQHYVPAPDGNRKPYCCLRTWNKSCPVCAHVASSRGKPNQKEAWEMRGKVRHLWCFVDHAVPDRPVSVFESNHEARGLGFWELLYARLKAKPKYAKFSDLEDGLVMILSAVMADKPSGSGQYVQINSIDFDDRDDQYDPVEMLAKSVCLDDCLVQLSYDALKGVLEGRDPEEEGEEGDDEEKAPAAVPARSSSTITPAKQKQEETSDAGPFSAGDVAHHRAWGRVTVVKVEDGEAYVTDESNRRKRCPVDDLDANPQTAADDDGDLGWGDDEPAPAKKNGRK